MAALKKKNTNKAMWSKAQAHNKGLNSHAASPMSKDLKRQDSLLYLFEKTTRNNVSVSLQSRSRPFHLDGQPPATSVSVSD